MSDKLSDAIERVRQFLADIDRDFGVGDDERAAVGLVCNAAERYRVLRDRHFENLPGDSATLWSGSQYERSEADLDTLAEWLLTTTAPAKGGQ